MRNKRERDPPLARGSSNCGEETHALEPARADPGSPLRLRGHVGCSLFNGGRVAIIDQRTTRMNFRQQRNDEVVDGGLRRDRNVSISYGLRRSPRWLPEALPAGASLLSSRRSRISSRGHRHYDQLMGSMKQQSSDNGTDRGVDKPASQSPGGLWIENRVGVGEQDDVAFEPWDRVVQYRGLPPSCE